LKKNIKKYLLYQKIFVLLYRQSRQIKFNPKTKNIMKAMMNTTTNVVKSVISACMFAGIIFSIVIAAIQSVNITL